MPENEHLCQKLDSVTMPLDGVTLIEAAAGTGKTYNIQNIVARLIVEKNFPIETLAVVTFTEKATKELSGRLRKMLELLTGVLNKCSSADEDAQKRARELLERFSALGITHKEQQERLAEALRNIDDCQVSTIHGFCSRLLSEYAFESSIAFQTKLEKNVKNLVSKLVKDFCRSKRYSPTDLPGWENTDPEELTYTVESILNRYNVQLVHTRPLFADENAIISRLRELQQEFISLPDKETPLEELRDKLLTINSQSGNDYLDSLKEDFRTSVPAVDADWHSWYDFFQRFRSGKFADRGEKSRKKNGPDHKEFVRNFTAGTNPFALAEDYCLIIEKDCKIFLQLEAVKFVRENLRQLKNTGNFHDYSDLLIKVDQALKNERFRHFIQKKFNAGIIDEFQDTDPLQYSIFKAIFVDRQDKRLIMVGDPRQAIYAFRGGDIATYLTARRECMENRGNTYTLSVNYRSSVQMIDAFNELFAHNDPFFTPEITFETVEKPDKPLPGIRRGSQTVEHPLSAVYHPDKNKEKIFDLCAEEISRMLASDEFKIPDGEDASDPTGQAFRKITPGDIAVLAYNNDSLDQIRQALARYNIPAIGERKGGIWNSQEAGELADFMQAVIDNANVALVREAMLSRICGADLTELNVESESGAQKLLQWQMKFIELAECWQNRGTASFITGMIKVFSLKSRLTVLTGGERVLSNYIQLGDLLAAAELSGKLSPQGVLKFLREKISGNNDEEFEMLESDRHAVRLLTIHKSKGLQFPIVFLPQLSARQPLSQKGLKFYHDNNGICCNIDELDSGASTLAAFEDMQELMRLVYVAVTRACYFCRLLWGKGDGEKKSPMAWLFMPDRKNTDLLQNASLHRNFVSNTVARPDFNSSNCIPDHMRQAALFDAYEPMFYTPVVNGQLNEPPEVKPPHSKNYIISYSALNELSQKKYIYADEEDFSDRDNIEENENTPGIPAELPETRSGNEKSGKLSGGIWDIPHGAAIGNAWHKVLEETDFTQGIDCELLKNVMASYGFTAPEYLAASGEMFKRLLEYQLPCGMKLGELTPERRLTELEFLLSSPGGFKYKHITDAVNEYVQNQFNAQLSPAGFFNMQQGFFTGFVDMIFEYNNKLYIVDWKSNAFEAVKEEFYGERLTAQMFKKRYVLQYLCYLAALLKFLEHRLQKEVDETLYNEYVGGVYYIFLRGMMLDEPGGVFSARVPYKTVRALADVISCGKED